nr:ekc/keops complex subunit [Quercus suber]
MTCKIAESFRRFGITDGSKNILAIKVSNDAVEVFQHLQQHVKGTVVPFTDSTLADMCDAAKLRKYYKLEAPRSGQQDRGLGKEKERVTSQDANRMSSMLLQARDNVAGRGVAVFELSADFACAAVAGLWDVRPASETVLPLQVLRITYKGKRKANDNLQQTTPSIKLVICHSNAIRYGLFRTLKSRIRNSLNSSQQQYGIRSSQDYFKHSNWLENL